MFFLFQVVVYYGCKLEKAPHGRRRELTPTYCPLASSCSLSHAPPPTPAHAHTYTQTHRHTVFLIKLFYYALYRCYAETFNQVGGNHKTVMQIIAEQDKTR